MDPGSDGSGRDMAPSDPQQSFLSLGPEYLHCDMINRLQLPSSNSNGRIFNRLFRSTRMRGLRWIYLVTFFVCSDLATDCELPIQEVEHKHGVRNKTKDHRNMRQNLDNLWRTANNELIELINGSSFVIK